MDLNKITKYVTQWHAPLSPKFNYRYVVIGLDNEIRSRKAYVIVFCENLMDVKAVEYGMYNQYIRYISHYKIADLDRFPRNTRGLSVIGSPFYAPIYWKIGMKEYLLRTPAAKCARPHIKNVMSKLGKS